MPSRRNVSSSRSLVFQRLILLPTVMVVAMGIGAEAFSSPSLTASNPSLVSSQRPFSCQSRLCAEIDDDEREREFARVRRRRSRYEEDDGYESESIMDAADMLEDEGFFDDLDDEDYDDEDYDDEDESRDVFSNTVIPNPLLDSIDPDGSAERFPELASDPRFWFDMFLFIAFLNFISFIGPRNPFPDMIPSMYTAGLPPPGM